MTNSLNGETAHLPNHFRFGRGSTHCSSDFGDIHSITPISLTGQGHDPHVEVRFTHGLRLDLSPATFAGLLRLGPLAMSKLPLLPDVHDAVLEGE